MVYSRTSWPPTDTAPSVASYSRGNQTHQGALGAAGAAQNAHGHAAFNMQADILQVPGAAVLVVFEIDMIKVHVAVFNGQAGSAAESVISGCSSSTSTMRLPQAMNRVSTIITMATIIRDMRISEA